MFLKVSRLTRSETTESRLQYYWEMCPIGITNGELYMKNRGRFKLLSKEVFKVDYYEAKEVENLSKRAI